jgi:hypothetical protein
MCGHRRTIKTVLFSTSPCSSFSRAHTPSVGTHKEHASAAVNSEACSDCRYVLPVGFCSPLLLSMSSTSDRKDSSFALLQCRIVLRSCSSFVFPATDFLAPTGRSRCDVRNHAATPEKKMVVLRTLLHCFTFLLFALVSPSDIGLLCENRGSHKRLLSSETRIL